MKHLDLFSGIGGFALAVEAVWPEAEHIFCDNDKFCQQVLKKHWPNSKIYGDIRELRLDTNPDSNGCKSGEKEINPTEARQQTFGNAEECDGIDLITGGFPCQPFSQAGKRRGTEDDRFLWPEMLRVIKEFKPRWVIGENVAGFTTMVQYQSSPEVDAQGNAIGEIGNTHHRMGRFVANEAVEALETAGYTVETFIIPACAVNAPHRRDRVWIVAHAKSAGSGRRPEKVCEKNGRQDGKMYSKLNLSNKKHWTCDECGGKNEWDGACEWCDAPDTESERGEWDRDSRNRRPRFENESWNQNWLEVATKFCGVDDGLPVELDGFKLTKAGHRAQRLKSLGNAIVPQVAIQIMKAIKTL